MKHKKNKMKKKQKTLTEDLKLVSWGRCIKKKKKKESAVFVNETQVLHQLRYLRH